MENTINRPKLGYYKLSRHATNLSICFPEEIYVTIEGNVVKVQNKDQIGEIISTFEVGSEPSIKWLGKDAKINVLFGGNQFVIEDNSVNNATYTYF